MYIKNLRLENFRNYKNQSINFSDGVNVLYGLNGQGKTNIIESIYMFCNGKSYRAARDSETIRFGEDYCKINIDFITNCNQKNAKIYISDKKSILINGLSISKLSELIGHFNAVIFTPENLNLIKEGPSERRQYLDVFISQLKPVYFRNLLNYYKVLKQRNNILRDKDKKFIKTISIWNEKLYEYGHKICDLREQTINILSGYVNDIQNDITQRNENILIRYMPSIKGDYLDKEIYISALEKNFEREMEQGTTLTGPHRDDFELIINDKNLKKYGSQGQIRTCVLSMKMAECEILKEFTGEYPILLLDDILSELDIGRRKYLIENIKDKQVIITCTNKDELKFDTVYNIKNGIAVREDV